VPPAQRRPRAHRVGAREVARARAVLRMLGVLLVLAGVFAATAHACPTCFAGSSPGQRSSYLTTTALLMGLPLGIVSALAFAFWRATASARKKADSQP